VKHQIQREGRQMKSTAIRFFIALCFSVLVLTGPAMAQMQALTGASPAETAATALPDPLTPEAARDLVARMSDDQVRSLLLERLDAVAKAETTTPQSQSLITRLTNLWSAFLAPTLGAINALPNLPRLEMQAISSFTASFGGNELFTLFAYTAIALAAGFLAAQLVNVLTRRWQGAELALEHTSLFATLRFLFRRLLRELLGLVAFYIVVRGVGQALLSPQQMTFAAPFVTALVWFPLLGAALARFVLVPRRSDLRLVCVNDRWARYLYRNLVGLVLLAGATMFVVQFNLANGMALSETGIGYWMITALFVYVGLIAWTAREGLVSIMHGDDPHRSEFDQVVARSYPAFILAVSAGIWTLIQIIAGSGNVELLLGAPHYKTMFWLLLLPPLDSLIRGLVRHLMPPMAGKGTVAETAYVSTKRSLVRIGRVIAWILVVLLIADAWNIDIMNLAASGVGQQFAGNLVEFLMTVAVGYIIYELVSLWINRRLAREQTAAGDSEEEAGGEGGGAGGSRLTTVLPLVRITTQVAITVVFGLLALSALGIDTTPLLAGAGILGLAIGFGAQKLVADIVSGVFFLIDDAFRVGEYVDIGGTMGTVEKISIRSMQLRHHRGLVHTIPYGEIPKLTNFSRDWVIMKLMFTVPFDTDPNKVKKIFKKIGAEMIQEPLFKDDFLEPFKSQGVFQFDDVGIVMRGKFMAKPGTQFTIRKEIYNRVRNEFKANGIEFARREVRVAIPGLEHGEHLNEDQKGAIAAGAAGAVQTQIEKQQAAEAAKSKP
jgi:moderate conductance mechanosensitive channel